MAVRFDADGDTLTVTTGLPTITSWTIMAHCKISADSNNYAIFFRVGVAGANPAYSLGTDVDGTTLQTWNNISGVNGSALTVGAYNNLAFTCAGTGAGQVLAYLNGVLNITTAGNAGISAGAILLADWGVGGEGPLNGCMQDIFLYDRVLTAAEILQQMRQRFPISTTSLNRWAPCHTAAEAAIVYAGSGGNWTVGGTLTTEGGPGIPWSTEEDTYFAPATVPAGKASKNTRTRPLGIQAGYPRRQGLVR